MIRSATIEFIQDTSDAKIPAELYGRHEFDEPTCPNLESSWDLIARQQANNITVSIVPAKVTKLAPWLSDIPDSYEAKVLIKQPTPGHSITGGEGAPNGICLVEDTVFAGKIKNDGDSTMLSIRRPVRGKYQEALKNFILNQTK